MTSRKVVKEKSPKTLRELILRLVEKKHPASDKPLTKILKDLNVRTPRF